jgi:hypothetical protein
LLSGNSYAAHFALNAAKRFSELAKDLQCLLRKYEMPLYLIECCIGDSFFKDVSINNNIPLIPVSLNINLAAHILGNASCLVTGRYHPAILASLGGTPCVFMGANSHNTVSLQDVLSYPTAWKKTFAALPDKNDITGIIDEVEACLTGKRERQKIQAVCAQHCATAKKIAAFCFAN